MFTSTKKCEIRHFHVVVVQWRLREMYKKAWWTVKVVVKPIAFLPFSFSFSLPSQLSLLKLPNGSGRGRGRGRWKAEKSPLPSYLFRRLPRRLPGLVSKTLPSVSSVKKAFNSTSTRQKEVNWSWLSAAKSYDEKLKRSSLLNAPLLMMEPP